MYRRPRLLQTAGGRIRQRLSVPPQAGARRGPKGTPALWAEGQRHGHPSTRCVHPQYIIKKRGGKANKTLFLRIFTKITQI